MDLSAILLAAWIAVLTRLSGQHEFCIALQDRSLVCRVGAANHSAYTLLRVDLSGDPNTIQLLGHIQGTALNSDGHDVQVAFSFNQEEEGWSTIGLGLSLPKTDLTGFELELNLKDDDGRIVGVMSYATALFDSLTIERHLGYLNQMLEGMTSDTTQLISKIDIIPPAERTLLLETWNKIPQLHQEYQTIHQLFEEQVQRTPTSIALVHDDQELTYSELNRRSNALAHRLIELGVKPDDLVAICVERSPAMIVAILAVLKAGGAYVPLDPAHGSERLLDILSDASPSIILADAVGSSTLGPAALSSLTVVDPNWQSGDAVDNPHVPTLSTHHLAYVIYTSGTTGKPKGVMIEHRQ
ncbi:hypothetical protein BGZ72_000832, partial [Mortierella alpina]